MNGYYEKALNDFQKKTVKNCEEAIRIAGLDKYETSKIIDEMGKKKFDPYCLTANISLECKTLDEVSDYYKEFTDVLIEVKKEVHKRELAKLKAKGEAEVNKQKKQNEDLRKLEEQIRKNDDELKKLADEAKKNDNPKPESPSPSFPKEESFDDKSKREYIEEIERQLKKNSISDQKLSDALGVSDWKAEMNRSSSWRTAQKFSFSIDDVIRKLSKQIVCDMCKESASPILDYMVLDKKEGKKKKFCSWECQNAWKDKNKGIDKDEAKEIKKELQEIKDYLKKNNENVNQVLNSLLTWMKKKGVVNITLSNDKLVIELSGKETKTIGESDLNSEQKALKSYLKNASGKKSLSRNELEKMVSRNYNEEGGRNKGKIGHGGIIAAILVVGLFLAVIIGLVIHKNKKRDY